MTPEQKMAVLLAADVPPARDIVFTVETARRIAQRRAWLSVAAMTPWAIVAAVLMWAVQPVLAPVGGDMGQALLPVMSILAGAALVTLVALWFARRFRPA